MGSCAADDNCSPARPHGPSPLTVGMGRVPASTQDVTRITALAARVR
jgi:hypothetical protein